MLLNIDANAFWTLALMPLLAVTAFFLCAWLVTKLIERK